MNEWWLIFILVAVALLLSLIVLYPLRRSKWVMLLLPVILIVVFTEYSYWGSFGSWQHYLQQKEANKLAQQMLKSIKNPAQLIAKLKEKLNEHPKSAKGWYLLGRLYSSQNEQSMAAESFAKAHELKPNNEQYTVNYAHALWMLNKQQFNPQIIAIFQSLLHNNPNQPDALAMLAMNAYLHQSYDQAIVYWQQLLQLVPRQSEEAAAIRKAIAKAQQQKST